MVALSRFMLFSFLLGCAMVLDPVALAEGPVAVRYTEGLVHGFLVLRTLDGETLANGDLIQVAYGDRVTNKLVFRFKDGSILSETAVFSQHHIFRLLSDHVIQKGPAFKHAMETSIDSSTGQITVHYTDDEGKEKVASEHLELPPDVANGLLFTLLKNIKPDAAGTTLSMVAATPKPRLVKLVITSRGEDSFSTGGSSLKAIHYIVKVDIGGVTGLVAPLIGKEPQDTHVWIMGGEAPAFVKSEGPLYVGGPTWRIELASPVWPPVPADTGR
jgi:hypothetical protein